jgi:hypothetical protein
MKHTPFFVEASQAPVVVDGLELLLYLDDSGSMAQGWVRKIISVAVARHATINRGLLHHRHAFTEVQRHRRRDSCAEGRAPQPVRPR